MLLGLYSKCIIIMLSDVGMDGHFTKHSLRAIYWESLFLATVSTIITKQRSGTPALLLASGQNFLKRAFLQQKWKMHKT